MELKPEQFKRFNELTKNHAGFDILTENQKKALASAIASYYLTLFKVNKGALKKVEIKPPK